MKQGELINFYTNSNNMNILLLFKGALSQETLIEIGNLINKQATGLRNEIRKAFSVFVELAQNIMNYSCEREFIDGKEVGVGIIIFKEENDNYKIVSGNKIANNELNKLIEKIDKINLADTIELKRLYKEQRKKPRTETMKSAGLGLIEIARKSNEKIEYTISEIDNESSFFEMNVSIIKEKRI